MKVVGIISEYNPIHNGHAAHIAATRELVDEECAVVCALSGNFVQRGDFAVFPKHARAATAVACGADLVIELPLPYVLSSAEGFARGAVRLLAALGVVTHLSFGSEAGETESLKEIADCLTTEELSAFVGEELKGGISYALARQRAVHRLLGEKAELLRSPNNILAVEYLKALREIGSPIIPLTVRRIGAAHDSTGSESSSTLRELLRAGEWPWGRMPPAAAEILKREAVALRGPVFMEHAEMAVLSRLRILPDAAFAGLPDASEGLGLRLGRFARSEPTIQSILENTKTKRYALSRLRRMLLCAALGVTADDALVPPPYIRVLAMNKKGMQVLRAVKEKTTLPVITKPAGAHDLAGPAEAMFLKEAAATDLYVLAYLDPINRAGGSEWTVSPRVL